MLIEHMLDVCWEAGPVQVPDAENSETAPVLEHLLA